MTVCIDTIVVLGMFGRNDPWLLIRQALMDRRLVWAVTTEILLEYEEDAAREMGITAAGQWTRFIELLEQTRGNIRHVSPTFRLHLITSGRDDYIVTGTATSPHSPRPDTILSPSPRRSSLPSICRAFLHSPFQRFRFQNFSFYHNASPPTSAPRWKNTPSPAPTFLLTDHCSLGTSPSPYGRELSKILRHGVGIHHAGLLKVVCGTHHPRRPSAAL